MRELYRSVLRAVGYVVIAVGDGLDALRWMESDRPDAVVLDLGLPRLSGRDVHRELQSSPDTQDIPIVIVSGTDISDLDPKQFACILKKPIRPEALIAAVQNCLRRPKR